MYLGYVSYKNYCIVSLIFYLILQEKEIWQELNMIKKE